MSSNSKVFGKVAWVDLTVNNAKEVSEFYSSVVGWDVEPVSMGDYQDFNMQEKQSGNAVAGVCHAKGVNAQLPPVWMMYITVEDMSFALQECVRLGGEVLIPPKDGGGSKQAVIKDPAGAICTLYQE